MTDAEKIIMVKAMSDETDDGVVSAFLSAAGEELYHYVDPFETTAKEDVLEQYGFAQAKLAAYRLNKRGWDFEVSHNENGVGRSYETGDIPASILKELTPKAGVV